LLALCLIIQILSGVFLAMKKYALPNISNYICKTLLDAEIGLKTKNTRVYFYSNNFFELPTNYYILILNKRSHKRSHKWTATYY